MCCLLFISQTYPQKKKKILPQQFYWQGKIYQILYALSYIQVIIIHAVLDLWKWAKYDSLMILHTTINIIC